MLRVGCMLILGDKWVWYNIFGWLKMVDRFNVSWMYVCGTVWLCGGFMLNLNDGWIEYEFFGLVVCIWQICICILNVIWMNGQFIWLYGWDVMEPWVKLIKLCDCVCGMDRFYILMVWCWTSWIEIVKLCYMKSYIEFKWMMDWRYVCILI